MTTTPREDLARLLGAVGTRSAFAARRTAPATDLHLEVKGIGRLRLPVSRAQAQRLCSIARPAHYGRGEETLLDRRVRDTWEIPKSRVKIDQRLWKRTLLPVLNALGADLGIPEGFRLRAELHSMLVYAPGQFFLRHQDSEKADGMVGTLAVTLPATFRGGAIVVEHRGEKVTYRGSKELLSFVAFYADCHHEVRPVQEGFRTVLTYNLMLEALAAGGTAAAQDVAAREPAAVAGVAESLREHFSTPRPPRGLGKDQTPRKPPSRLVYLLDHQYTERGLGWHRLKGEDAARVAVLRAAAERAGCEAALALAEIHETWECVEEDWDEPWRRGRRSWRTYDEEDDDEDLPGGEDLPAGPDAHTLGDILDHVVTLHVWFAPPDERAEPIANLVGDDELCATTPSSDLAPHASEYEGYMGNYGNTMDRWYRRAAVVVWQRANAFAVRAELSPVWAMADLRRILGTGGAAEVREKAAALLPFWKSAGEGKAPRGFVDNVLRVAEGLDEPALVAALLKPIQLEALTPSRARALVALVRRYGEGWARPLVAEWFGPHHAALERSDQDRRAWLEALPRLCTALRAAGDDGVGTLVARLILHNLWQHLREELAAGKGLTPPSQRDKELAALGGTALSLLAGAAEVQASELRDEALRFLCADENERLLVLLLALVKRAAGTVAADLREAAGLDLVQRHCARLLESRLERSVRGADDWSIAPPPGCACDLCATLGRFLADPRQIQLEWPLAEQRRRHVHSRLDLHELPVRHETLRKGSPYVLILTKTNALFEREAAARRAWQAELDALAANAAPKVPRRAPGATKPKR